jgi:hypothetical protein
VMGAVGAGMLLAYFLSRKREVKVFLA